MESKQQFVSELQTTKEIFENRLFRIPDYQRGYSWEEKQLSDLTKDLDQIADKDHKHYTGTIVISWNDAEKRFDIVDGQQRITTLIILLHSIYKLDSTKFEDILTTYISRPRGENVLITNAETNRYFRDKILKDQDSLTEEIKPLRNLRFAKQYLGEWVGKNAHRVDDIYETITEKLGFLCFAPTRTEEIGIMFEVINNRGKSLSELEKIKNYFIYYSTINNHEDLKNRINENWGVILKDLNSAGVTSNEDENRFLRNCYIVFYDTNKSKSWHVYDQLKIKYPPGKLEDVDTKLEKISDFVEFLRDCAKFYSFLFKAGKFADAYEGDCKDEINKVLKRLRCHPTNASILPLYLATMTSLYKQPKQVQEILELIEIANFRKYILPNASRTDSHQGELFTWAKDLYGHNITFDDVKLKLRDFVLDHCPEETFIQSLTVRFSESIDFYSWPGLRFFLASYEEHLNKEERKETWDIEKILITNDQAKQKESTNDYLSREHIWAVKNRESDFPVDFHDKRRLGNFVLLGLTANQQLNNDDVEHKVDHLIKHSSSSMIQVNKLDGYFKKAKKFVSDRRGRKTKNYHLDIARKLIDLRENELIQFALKRWKLPEEKMDNFKKIDSFTAQTNKRDEVYYLNR